MADNAEGSSEPQISFRVKTSGDSNHQITMSEAATVLDLKAKLAGAEFENIPVERQRLIYSGRVMKNDDPLSTYKIKSGNTIHMVKSAASNPAPPPSSSSAPAPAAVPANMSAGTANDILAGLTGARYAGHVNLPSRETFGPDGGMGPPPSEERLADLLSEPGAAQAMNAALDNPQFLDYLIQSHPHLRNTPNVREIIQSPLFRSMMTNPDLMRQMVRMQRTLGGGGLGGGAGSLFPAPGATDTTPDGAAAAAGGAQSPSANPFGAMPFMPFPFGAMPPASGAGAGAGGAAAPASPFAAIMDAAVAAEAGNNPGGNAPQAGSDNAAAAAAAGQGQGGAAANPFAALLNPANMPPELMAQLMQSMWGGPGAAGGSPSSPFSPPHQPPQDTRPPEERYADQLRTLNDMGFYDFDRNVAALRRSGGSVQGAIEYLLNP